MAFYTLLSNLKVLKIVVRPRGRLVSHELRASNRPSQLLRDPYGFLDSDPGWCLLVYIPAPLNILWPSHVFRRGISNRVTGFPALDPLSCQCQVPKGTIEEAEAGDDVICASPPPSLGCKTKTCGIGFHTSSEARKPPSRTGLATT